MSLLSATPNTISTLHRSTISPQTPPTPTLNLTSTTMLTMSGRLSAYAKYELGFTADTLTSPCPTLILSVLAIHHPNDSYSYLFRSSNYFVPTCYLQTRLQAANSLLRFDSFYTPGRGRGLTGHSRSFRVSSSASTTTLLLRLLHVHNTACLSQPYIASPGLVKAPDAPQPLSPPKRATPAPPSHPDRQKPPPLATSSTETNPFTRRSIEHGTPPVQPADPERLPPQRTNKISQNPFLARDHGADKVVPSLNVSSQGKLPPLPPRKPMVLAGPPRRPSETLPAPIASTANLITPSGPPLIPVKPTHVMSPLMKQSLEASKHAQSMKRAEEQLDRERVLQVLKTTSSSSSASNNSPSARTRSLSPSKQLQKQLNGHVSGSASGGSDDATCVPPLPRRRKPSLPLSTSSSALSLEQVASATLASSTVASSRPPLPSRHVPALSVSTTTHFDHSNPPAITASSGSTRPPTHPHRRPSTSTEPTVNDSQPTTPSSPRVSRSRSVTSSSSAPLPPPPPRRKRPESMQLTPTSDAGELPSFPVPSPHAQMHGRTGSFRGLSRHLSLTRGREREPSDSSPIANIQKTLTNFQLKAQPKLDAVRYKAEAGFSKRGYVHHTQLSGTRWREEGEEGLMADARWAATNVNRDLDSEPSTDDEPSSGDEQGARRTTKTTTSVAPYHDFLTESDNLKLPMGEGWKPL